MNLTAAQFILLNKAWEVWNSCITLKDKVNISFDGDNSVTIEIIGGFKSKGEDTSGKFTYTKEAYFKYLKSLSAPKSFYW